VLDAAPTPGLTPYRNIRIQATRKGPLVPVGSRAGQSCVCCLQVKCSATARIAGRLRRERSAEKLVEVALRACESVALHLIKDDTYL
jgi:hypothetical protein